MPHSRLSSQSISLISYESSLTAALCKWRPSDRGDKQHRFMARTCSTQWKGDVPQSLRLIRFHLVLRLRRSSWSAASTLCECLQCWHGCWRFKLSSSCCRTGALSHWVVFSVFVLFKHRLIHGFSCWDSTHSSQCHEEQLLCQTCWRSQSVNQSCVMVISVYLQLMWVTYKGGGWTCVWWFGFCPFLSMLVLHQTPFEICGRHRFRMSL